MMRVEYSWLITIVYICVSMFSQAKGGSVEDSVWYAQKQFLKETGIFKASRVHVLRLGPGEDLLTSLWRYARVTDIHAASVVSVVGSLTQTNLRYANQENGTSHQGHFEIVSVVGNIDFQKVDSADYEGSGHVHLSCSDENGATTGGHVLEGNIVYTTAEITLLEISDGVFDRVLDDAPNGSGYYELQVVHREVAAQE
jgi:predicted DNA-binding protein with PD1-like motif